MATNLKYTYPEETYRRVIPPAKESPKKADFQFSYAQAIVMWAIIAGMMIATFLFGMFTGREQGVKIALNEHGQLEMPVPIVASTKSIEEPIVEKTLPSLKAVLPTVRPVGKIDAPKVEKQVLAKNPIAAKPLVKTPSKPPVKEAKVKKPAKTLASLESKKPVVKSTKVAKEASNPLKSVAVSNSVGSGYYVQVAARKDANSAKELASKVQSGLPVLIEKAAVGGRDYFRVLVGPYQDAKAANSAQKKLGKQKLARGKPFVKKVN